MEQTLGNVHKNLCRAAGIIVVMLVRRRYNQDEAENAKGLIDEASTWLQDLIWNNRRRG